MNHMRERLHEVPKPFSRKSRKPEEQQGHGDVEGGGGLGPLGETEIESSPEVAMLAAETELLEGRYLNELAPFDQPDCQPTVENVLAVLFDRIRNLRQSE